MSRRYAYSLIYCATALAACAPNPPAETAIDAAPIIAAERAFAAEVAANGWNAGVRAFATADAIGLNPGPVKVMSTLTPDDDEGGSPLQWWPAYAGIARSGDFGFTTGPYSFIGQGYVGHYFTVWRKQPDGGWKWIFDGGVDVLDDAPPAQDATVEQMPVAARDGESEQDALRAVKALDAALAAEAAQDAPAAIASRLSADARVNRASLPRAVGLEASRAALAEHAHAIRFEAAGAAASQAGDMVFTYGSARWTAGGQDTIGYYARIWQMRPEGWRLVFDEIVPHRDPP